MRTIPQKGRSNGNKTGRIFGRKRSDYGLLLMALPFVLFIIVFNYAQLFGWLYAFVDYKPWKAIWEQDFIGLANFERLFAFGSQFPIAFRNSIIYGVLGIITSPLPAIFAVLLSEVHSSKAKRAIQTMSSFPNFISWILVYSICFMFFGAEGQINKILVSCGLMEKGSNILGDPSIAYIFQQCLTIWKALGWSAIIYMAAIAGIDAELYDAADVDGANRFQKILYVTVPGILPTFFVLLVLNISSIANAGFDQFYVFYNPLVSEQLEILPTYAYRVGIGRGEISFATAIGMTQSIISIVLLFTVNKLAKKISGNAVM